MSLTVNNKTAKLTESKTILQELVGVETERIETTTYNIDDMLKKSTTNLYNNKDLLRLLYPFFIRHILKQQYENKNFIFTLCYEPTTRTTRILKSSTIELIVKWNGNFTNIRPLAEHIYNKIENMEDVNYVEPIQNIRLVIFSQEEQLIKHISNIPIPKEENTNENKTFLTEECAICISKKPNVLFCNCGHLCICSDCFENIQQIEKTPCVVCKEENKTIRILP